jgi:NAD-dependent dihydropyrimidine dehydrogenase PreA subunit
MPWLAGYPREKIEWFPTIDEKKCVSCGMCMNCGREVFDWNNGEKGKPVVARPYECVVGCSTCANLCQGNAISFQDIKTVKSIYIKEGIYPKVKAILKEEGTIK